MIHKPRKREMFVLLTDTHIYEVSSPYSVQKLWPINKILPRTDNSTVENQGLSLLFIAHDFDEIYLSGIFP